MAGLGLPRDLAGYRVLDIGCNEGFFAIECKRRGAAEVIGIDKSDNAIEIAKTRAGDIDFRRQSWAHLPEGPFDLILLLSTLHYERSPQDLLRRIADNLSTEGLLILECGATQEQHNTIRWTQRKGVVHHPTLNLLKTQWLKPFSFSQLGRSVDQPGDPVPRWVFHCTPRKPIVLLVDGPSGVGKTTFVHQLMHQDVMELRVDGVLARLREMKNANTPLLKLVAELHSEGVTSTSRVVSSIREASLQEEFADVIAAHLRHDQPLTIVEGYGLDGDVRHRIAEQVEGIATVWVAQSEHLAPEHDSELRDRAQKYYRYMRQARRERDRLRSDSTDRESVATPISNARADEELETLKWKYDRLRSRRSVRFALALADAAGRMLRR